MRNKIVCLLYFCHILIIVGILIWFLWESFWACFLVSMICVWGGIATAEFLKELLEELDKWE